MPRQQLNLKDNTIQIMDNVFKNIEPKTYQMLLNEIVINDIKNTKTSIEKYIRNRLGLVTTNAKHTKNYWILRGWSPSEAYIKAKENKQQNCKSVFSREFWLEKINPNTNNLYTIEEADFERNSKRPIRKEYWMKQGIPEEEAQQLAVNTKNTNNKKGANANTNSTVRRVTSKRCVEYFTARGHTIEEATELVSKNQLYFSKEICIEKYGEEEGFKIWQDRQIAWQETISAKPAEELARINKLKLFKRGSVSSGETQLFEQLLAQGIMCSKQHAILKNEKSYYVYDIVYNNKIIEYNGDYWHASPKKYKADDIVKLPNKITTAKEIWEKDNEKINFAQRQGYEVLVVWESNFKENKKEVLNKCIQFLTQ